MNVSVNDVIDKQAVSFAEGMWLLRLDPGDMFLGYPMLQYCDGRSGRMAY